MRLKMKNRSQRYLIYRPRPRHGHKYTKEKMWHSIMMVACIKQYLSNIWSSIHEKVNTEADLKEAFLMKKVSRVGKGILSRYLDYL